MEYHALYRKFRPRDFDDVKGQNHIVTTLKNQIKANRIGHAYLFSGTRGTGKTTVAKILAKAVNCEDPVDGGPCNQCTTCNHINSNTSMNIIEIDAASNNGVDDVREIVEEVRYSPAQGKYKVYIIDEVHMLSKSAFNALLKTLEEPPSYVIFILATTEPQKLPLTILSRCQRYDFKRITIEAITNRLYEILKKEDVEAEDKALRYVARVADGSMRDALSLLDQCIAFYYGEMLTYDRVLDVLGAMDVEVYSFLLTCISDKRVSEGIEFLDKIILEGKELTTFVNEFTWYLRNVLLVKSSEKNLDKIDISLDDIPILQEQSQKIEMNTIIRYIQIFSELSNQIKFSSQKRVLVEVSLIKLMKPQMDVDYNSLLERIRALEEQVENGITIKESNNREAMITKESNHPKKMIKEKQEKLEEAAKALPEDLKLIGQNWRKITSRVGSSWRPNLEVSIPRVGNDNNLILTCPDKLDLDRISGEEHVKELKDIIAKVIGKDIDLDIHFKLDNNNQDKMDSLHDLQSLSKLNEKVKVEYEN